MASASKRKSLSDDQKENKKIRKKEPDEKADEDVRWFLYTNFNVYGFPLSPTMHDLVIQKRLQAFTIEKFGDNNNVKEKTELLKKIQVLCSCYEQMKLGPSNKVTLAELFLYFQKLADKNDKGPLPPEEKAICIKIGKMFSLQCNAVPQFLLAWTLQVCSLHFEWMGKPDLELRYFIQSLGIIIRYELYTHRLEVAVKILARLYFHFNWNAYRYRGDMVQRPKLFKQYEYMINLARSLISQSTDENSKDMVKQCNQVFYFVYPLFIEFTLDITKWYIVSKRNDNDFKLVLDDTVHELPICLLKPDYILPEVPYKNIESLQSVYDHLQSYKQTMVKLSSLPVMAKFKKKLPDSKQVMEYVLNQILIDLPYLVAPEEKE